jgi:phosphonate transport system substrate-binding protein
MKPWSVLLVALIWLQSVPVFAAAPKEYVFAVLPQQPPVAMHTLWRPLLDRLEQELGVRLKLKLYGNMTEFEEGAVRGEGDFVFSTPVQLPLFRKQQGYTPLVRGTRYLNGIVFVRKDSPITSVEELAGKEVAFVGARNL